MASMNLGIIDLGSVLELLILALLPVTLHAVLPWHNYLAMPVRQISGPVYDETVHEGVHLLNAQMVTLMAINFLVYTLLPLGIGITHQMTANAKLGIVLSIIKYKIGRGTAANKTDKCKNRDDYLTLEGKLLSTYFSK